jgi:hypothetical protein
VVSTSAATLMMPAADVVQQMWQRADSSSFALGTLQKSKQFPGR